MKILITGAQGFVGSHLSEFLATKGHQVITPKLNLLNATDTALALSQLEIEAVIHLAAIAVVGSSYSSPAKILRNNIFAQLNLLETLRQKNSSARILIVCSADEYGHSSKKLDEHAPLMPTSPYAVSKIGQDFLGLQYHLSYGMNVIRIRPFNHIGERQRPGFVVPDFARQIAEIEKSTNAGVMKVGNLNSVRDFTDVKDMVRAYELALTKGESGEIYNIGSGKGVKIKEVLDILIKLSSAKITVKTDKSRFRPGEVSKLVADPAKFQRLTGWKPTISLEKTLNRVLEYWRKEVH
jgi:GDP-4-dehydro-6-deoxy-D-mannose reductase